MAAPWSSFAILARSAKLRKPATSLTWEGSGETHPRRHTKGTRPEQEFSVLKRVARALRDTSFAPDFTFEVWAPAFEVSWTVRSLVDPKGALSMVAREALALRSA